MEEDYTMRGVRTWLRKWVSTLALVLLPFLLVFIRPRGDSSPRCSMTCTTRQRWPHLILPSLCPLSYRLWSTRTNLLTLLPAGGLDSRDRRRHLVKKGPPIGWITYNNLPFKPLLPTLSVFFPFLWLLPPVPSPLTFFAARVSIKVIHVMQEFLRQTLYPIVTVIEVIQALLNTTCRLRVLPANRLITTACTPLRVSIGSLIGVWILKNRWEVSISIITICQKKWTLVRRTLSVM